MQDYLSFRKMITPAFIQIIFWIGVVALIVGGLWAMDQSILTGVLGLLVGLLVWRIYCELMLILFKIYERLGEIAEKTGK
jgi:quinol-cytochrome oxidoreductase complex cytochrome b subunit